MPISLHPSRQHDDGAEVIVRRAAAHPGDERIRPYDTGYDVRRGYEAAPSASSGSRGDVAWFGGRGRVRY
jgi:hypothetical protein